MKYTITCSALQGVLFRIENPRVGGSNPPPGTIFFNKINDLHRIVVPDL